MSVKKISAKKISAKKRIIASRTEVAIVMGSHSDWKTMSFAAEMFNLLRVKYETKVVSAHRTPKLLYSYAERAAQQGLKIIIAGAGGAAHLPGMLAAITELPVLGVPIESKTLAGLDSLLSIAQMPKGIPVATFAIGQAGAANAALFAAAILALDNSALHTRLNLFRLKQTKKILDNPNPAYAP
jgi:5-(carboxyamino)imidazole ribonucleotide mutase